ncbi:prostatic acid phosphatase [Scaptodrosophila lebanonensis]|uniref:acid phosphatase n=1 Tax=Drosophila lebanonensis TaxID=7225 RepID=A0A6J2T9W6_DROLE|nr:prostatic acid phosphatase [Scaptodrosophila lebanonensis]
MKSENGFINTLTQLCLICVFCLAKLHGLEQNTYSNVEGNADDSLPGKLKFAHVIFRHGDRMPVDPYPTDPWNNQTFWPARWGQLTNRGKRQHYELGKWLRKRYNALLGATYDRQQIFVQSTDVDRTLMSAQSNLAGFYEPEGSDIWNEDLKWQPIPVHTKPEKDDPVLAAKAPCSAFDYALSALQSSPEYQAKVERYKYLFDYLSQHSGRMVETFLDINYINNTLFIETLYNKTLPEWTKKVYGSADMTYATNFAFSVNTMTRQLARLKVGPLLKEIFNRFVDKSQGKLTPDRNMWIYSAHDTTIANVLNGLNMFQLHSPPYTACIMMEMRVDDYNNSLISIFYKNSSAEPLPMNIPGCGVSCPLNTLLRLYSDYLPVDWERECKLSTMMLTYEEANIGAATGILIFIIIILLCASYALMIYYRRRNYHLYSSSYAQMA